MPLILIAACRTSLCASLDLLICLDGLQKQTWQHEARAAPHTLALAMIRACRQVLSDRHCAKTARA